MALKANPGGWFEIPVADLDRAVGFYEKAFGIALHREKVNDVELAFFPMERGAMGIAGALVVTPPVKPSHEGTTIYFSVESIEPMLASIAKAGGKTLIAKQSIGQYGFFAQFEDSEGNRVALHEMSPGQK